MIKLNKTLKSIVDIQGELPNEVESISTDTRTLEKGQGFVALSGENFNAVDFIDQVIDKGASFVAVSKTKENIKKIDELKVSIPIIYTSDSLTYLQELATSHRKNMNLKYLVGITGSNGKTTTKNMLTHLLVAAFNEKVLFTTKNYNNHIGVPLTLLNIKAYHQIAIVEMGTNHFGEIQKLCDIALPNVGVITSIGDSHLEFLKNREGVFKEKSALFFSVMKNTSDKGYFTVSKNDPYLTTLPEKESFKKVGLREFKNSFLLGEHNFMNLSQAYELSCMLYPEHENIFKEAAQNFQPSANRSSWMEVKGRRIFLDAYNANPSSMKASLQGFFNYLKVQNIALADVTFVLGDMNELGREKAVGHESVGAYLKEHQAKNVIFIGHNFDDYLKGFPQGKFLTSITEWEDLPSEMRNAKILFIKGSRSLQLEKLIDII